MVLNAHTKGNGIPTTLRYPEPRTQEPEVLKQHIVIACATIMCCLHTSDSSRPGSEYLRLCHHL